MKKLTMVLMALGLLLPGRVGAQDRPAAETAKPPLRRVVVGLGLSRYSPDFSPLDRAYTNIENQYLAQGYSVPPHDPAIGVGELFTVSIRLRASRLVGVLLEGGLSTNGTRLDCKSGSFSLLFFPPVASTLFEPYLGAGVGHYGFSTSRSYHEAVISPVGSYGSYTYLDHIDAKGGGTGLPLTVGVDLHKPSWSVGLGAFASYLVMAGRAEGTMPDGSQASLKLSTFMAGVRLQFYL